MTTHALMGLAACPFCGRQPRTGFASADIPGMPDCGYHYIECCDVHVHRDFEDESVAAWNTRTQLRTAASGGGELSHSDMAMLLVARCLDMNAESGEYRFAGVTDGGKEAGDWIVTVGPYPPTDSGAGRDGVDALRAEVTSLRLFANEIMADWWEGDLDGGSRQDIAERHGLIAGFEVTEPCGELCNCAEMGEWPTQCFRRMPLLTGDTAIAGAAGEASDGS